MRRWWWRPAGWAPTPVRRLLCRWGVDLDLAVCRARVVRSADGKDPAVTQHGNGGPVQRLQQVSGPLPDPRTRIVEISLGRGHAGSVDTAHRQQPPNDART